MSANEFAEYILHVKKENQQAETVDESAAFEVSQLISGSFVYSLYCALWQSGFDMEALTEHLEAMYDSGNHLALIYFIFILSDAVDFVLPLIFTEKSANDALAPILSAAIIEDWLEYDATSDIEIIDS